MKGLEDQLLGRVILTEKAVSWHKQLLFRDGLRRKSSILISSSIASVMLIFCDKPVLLQTYFAFSMGLPLAFLYPEKRMLLSAGWFQGMHPNQ